MGDAPAYLGESPAAFELKVVIRTDDIDTLGHVNNTVYLRWVQDAATAHWRTLAPEDDQDAISWVVLRHEIDYRRPATLDDRVMARTWVGVADGLSFERHTAIIRAPDAEILAVARTLWCPVDARSGRPKRVSQAVRRLFGGPTG
jgi:acyl-CoA thioester hydrolase